MAKQTKKQSKPLPKGYTVEKVEHGDGGETWDVLQAGVTTTGVLNTIGRFKTKASAEKYARSLA